MGVEPDDRAPHADGGHLFHHDGGGIAARSGHTRRHFTFLLAGWLTAAFFVGDLGARFFGRGPVLSRGMRLAFLVVAIAVLLLVRLLPFVGALVILLAVVAGIGAWTLCLFRRYRGRDVVV